LARAVQDMGGITNRMIDTLANLLFRCWHRRLSRPMTPVQKSGTPEDRGFVICLDCGKKFSYDMSTMAMGKALKDQDQS